MRVARRRLKELGKRGLRKLFETGQSCGFDLLPRHFYSEIPDVRDLKHSEGWRARYSMAGVRGIEAADQLAFVAECCDTLVERQRTGDIYAHGCSCNEEAGFGPVEADFLFCFIAANRPQRIVQIGCGVSTAIIRLAAAEATYRPELICIDPYPTPYLTRLDREGEIRLIAEKAQRVDLSTLTDLGENGLLFVDSTHTVKPGSEVGRIVLEVLPRLEKGSWAHFHDIYFPYDYAPDLLADGLFFSHESIHLHAYLAGNAKYSVRAALAMLHDADPGKLQRFLPNYRPARMLDGLQMTDGHFPSSLYLQVIG